MTTFVIFEAGDKTCALAREEVVRVAPMPALAQPPTKPAIVSGFLNLAGDPLPVLEAAAVLGLAADRAGGGQVDPLYRHILIAHMGLGLLVDRVTDVRTLATQDAQIPGDDATLNGCVRCIVSDGEEAIYVLDAEQLLTRAERDRLAQLTELERARLEAWTAPS